jgi:3-hydroxyanthranilate 3,4-dioxygenase
MNDQPASSSSSASDLASGSSSSEPGKQAKLMEGFPVLNLMKYVQENSQVWVSPERRRIVYNGDFIVFVTGGPATPENYHIYEGDEWFLQIKGDMVLHILVDGVPRRVDIREGEMYCNPGGIPHSPWRTLGTVGVVIERRRKKGEIDHLQWHCYNCGEIVYKTDFIVADDFFGDFKDPAQRVYKASEEERTCKKCGSVYPTQMVPRIYDEARHRELHPQ